MQTSSDSADAIREQVAKEYAGKAQGAGCGRATPRVGATSYADADIADLPSEAVEASFGCGNPFAFAGVREGDTVVDLGSGAGIDLLLAAKRTGPRGKVTAEGSGSLSLDYDLDWFRVVEDPYQEPNPNDLLPRRVTDSRFAGLALRWNYSDTRGAIYTVGAQDGQAFSASLRLDHPALGSDGRALSLGYRWETYRKLPWSPTSSVAVQVAGGIRTSSSGNPGNFSLGGVPEQDVVQSILDSARAGTSGYLRGYERSWNHRSPVSSGQHRVPAGAAQLRAWPGHVATVRTTTPCGRAAGRRQRIQRRPRRARLQGWPGREPATGYDLRLLPKGHEVTENHIQSRAPARPP